MSQVGGHGPDGSVIAPPASMAPGGSPSTRPQSMAPSMMPGFMGGLQSPPMSFYGAPPMGGFPGYSEFFDVFDVRREALESSSF